MRTYTARKKEIEALSEELPSLEAYVDYLKHEAARINNQINSTQKQQLVNSCLRDTVHRQQFALARVHSAVSAFTTCQEKLIPFDNFIHLRKSKKQRLQTLLATKPRMLRDARRFMSERIRFMDLSVPSSEQSCFVSLSGDYCALKFVVMPLEGTFSAKQVFDTLKFYLFHMEIMISEVTGDLTFDGRAYGVIAIDYVDKDELHPYTPNKRLRQDLTSILTKLMSQASSSAVYRLMS
ncbi:hypothetical protein BBP00_00009820 [Phytophthora kernoviae]|uniref:Uncharacterized protein n=1 Tax=Phytophthora kernoviae TaxID=325452 RepID=A0A3F2RBG4_9STRA|nr:hypothetical protein BBP00_00009820 [Phytophthora kernoviae]